MTNNFVRKHTYAIIDPDITLKKTYILHTFT